MKYWKEATSTISAMSQPKAKSLRLVKSTGSPRQQTPSSTLRPTGSPRQQTPSSTLRPTGSPRQTSLSPHTCGQTNTLAKVLHSSSPSYPHKQPLKPTNHSLELSFNPSPQRKSVSNPPQTPTLSKSFTCTFCQKSYKHIYNKIMKREWKERKKHSPLLRVWKYSSHAACLYVYYIVDFGLWKEEFECKTSSWLVQLSGKKELIDGGKTYYYCNRSGHFHTRGTGERHLKTTRYI